MLALTGRTQKRIAREVGVELARLDTPFLKETATTENVSARGMRVVTKHVWRPGELVLLGSPGTGLHTQARIVYCQRLENKGFAIGLELLGDREDWMRSN
jgi:hypothetical protein